MIYSIVLAAGFSKRFGADKRFYGQPPLLLRTLNNIVRSQANIIVVHRQHDDVLLETLATLPVQCVAVEDQYRGQGASIAAAVKHVITLQQPRAKDRQEGIEAVLICLADMPLIKPQTISKISRYANQHRIVRPVYQGKPGHPVCFGSDFFSELAALTSDVGGKHIIGKHSERVDYIDVDDHGVLFDVDTPEDACRLSQNNRSI
ncbi:NTP transferase domain-containing protein [Thalassotalea maritima]|uniref:nucleotidyltransferase family protein n=1 Tax=Thalassotalea maritima TaxID=3242416 RepID=UPI00352866CD